MTSDTDHLDQDISQEELDFSDLFLYNLHEEKFLTGTDNGDQVSPPHNGTTSPSLQPHSFDDNSSFYLSSSILSFPATDQVCEPSAEFSIHDITSKGEAMPAPSPRIEITPSGDSLQTQPLEVTSSSAALLAYREQPSPACSNSSGGWPSETFSPGTSPCDSPNGGGGGLGLSASDLSSGLQGFHTSSAHSSPGTSPRTSITEETFLVPQHQRSTSPLSHPQRCRSTSPQGKRTYDQCSSPSLGTPVKQRSRSPSPSPLTSDPQMPQLQQQLPDQPQVLAEPFQAPFHSTLEEMLNSLSSSLPKSLPSKMVRASDDACVYSEAPRKDCVYVDDPRKDCVYVDTRREDCVYVDAPKNDCVYVEMQGWGGVQERKIRQGAGANTGIGVAGAGAGDEMGIGPGAGPGAGSDAGIRAGARAGAEVTVKDFYAVTSGWHSTVAPVAHHPTTYSGVPLVFLPSLEWPLPSGSGPCKLVVRQQPRPHHRAHYETEGSRGPVKTPNGGHPVVQLCGYSGASPLGLDVFIGTAEDERVLKPHAFYQVHRITGKTVTTASRERVINGTKVLEIPLETKNNMTAVIDCAGILKLRNADIELRNGETDVGRKNTRVRLVFRVHIPHPDGQLVSLQVASVPIECSQRSAQDLPDVENQDLDRCSVLGGQQMMLTGQNFNCDSRVVFSEKTHDGQQIWEMEAIVDRNKSQSSVLFVEVPPYHNPAIYHPAKVNFYVINGKKKRSQPQHFTYTPLLVPVIKPEPVDDYQLCMSTSTGFPGNPYFQHIIPTSLDANSQSRATPLTACHLKTLGPTYQLVDSAQPVQFSPRTSTTLSSSPIIYQAMNHQHPGLVFIHPSPDQRPQTGQHHQNKHPSLVSYPAVSVTSLSHYYASDPHLTEQKHGKAGQRESLQTPGITSSQVRQHYQADVQTVVPLGQTPPPPALVRSTHNQAYMGSPTPRGHNQAQQVQGTGCQHALLPEKITIKQENLNPTYLEDVNDIIRRDLN